MLVAHTNTRGGTPSRRHACTAVLERRCAAEALIAVLRPCDRRTLRRADALATLRSEACRRLHRAFQHARRRVDEAARACPRWRGQRRHRARGEHVHRPRPTARLARVATAGHRTRGRGGDQAGRAVVLQRISAVTLLAGGEKHAKLALEWAVEDPYLPVLSTCVKVSCAEPLTDRRRHGC